LPADAVSVYTDDLPKWLLPNPEKTADIHQKAHYLPNKAILSQSSVSGIIAGPFEADLEKSAYDGLLQKTACIFASTNI
jgi:hypothetical protein